MKTNENKQWRTCLLEFAHICVYKRQPSLAILPPLEGLWVFIPPELLASDAVLSKQLVAMLLSEEPVQVKKVK